MRPIEHGPFVADRARAWIGGEQIHDFLRRFPLCSAWRERLVDHIDLRRMNRQHAAESGAPYLRRALAKARLVPEIAMDRLDGGHARGPRSDQAEAARQLICEIVAAVLGAVADRAELSREVLGAPGHRSQPRHADVAYRRKHAFSRLTYAVDDLRGPGC